MTFEIAFAFAIAAAAIIAFASGRLPPDLVGIGVLLATVFGGLISHESALMGFANPAIFTIGAIFVISAGLTHTGVAFAIGRVIRRLAGRSEARLIVVSMLLVAGLSAFMNSVGAVAVLLPAVVAAARDMQAPVARVLMPVSFGSLLGATLTLVGTPSNILVSGVLANQGYQEFGLFEFTPFGVVLLAVGVAVVLLTRRALLPDRPAGAQAAAMLPAERKQHAPYRLEERLFEAALAPESALAGQTLRDSALGRTYGIGVLAILRDGRAIAAPVPDVALLAGDRLILSGRAEDVERMGRQHPLEISGAQSMHTEFLQAGAVGIVEVVLGPRSRFIGRTLAQLRFREQYGANVLGIWRDGAPRRTRLAAMPLQAGDAMLLQAPVERLAQFRASPDLVVLTEETGARLRRRRAPIAVAILLGFVIALVLHLQPVAIVAVTAAAAMVLTGCVRMSEARQSIEWRVIVLIGSMSALAQAVLDTGAAAWLADGMAASLGALGPLPVMAGVLLLTAAFAHVMGNHVSALLMAPLAIHAALGVGADPRMFAMAVALGATLIFMNPYAHPGHILVTGPGNYRFGDFVRFGALLGVLALAAAFGMLLLVFGN